MQDVLTVIHRLVRHDEGQDLLEYGLIAVLIAIFAMGAVGVVGNSIHDLFWARIGSASF